MKRILSIIVVCLLTVCVFSFIGNGVRAEETVPSENTYSPDQGISPSNNSTASFSGGSTITSVGDMGKWSSCYWHTNNILYASYYDATNLQLKYAYRENGIWNTGPSYPYTVDTGNVGQYTSIGMDTTGHPIISYYDAANQDLKIAIWTANPGIPPYFKWTLDRKATSGVNDGLYTSLKIGSNNVIQICYYDATNKDSKYITRTGGRGAQ